MHSSKLAEIQIMTVRLIRFTTTKYIIHSQFIFFLQIRWSIKYCTVKNRRSENIRHFKGKMA